MSTQFIDRRCTIDVHPISKGYSFEYGGKIHKSRTEKGVHNFFLQEYGSNKLDTVKLRFNDKKYYLHFTLDEPEKFTSKKALRSILAQENGGAWIEEKNGIKRYFIEDGWLFSNVREVSEDEFNAYQSTSLIQKITTFALSALSLTPTVSTMLSRLSLNKSSISNLIGFSLLQADLSFAQMPAFGEFRINNISTQFIPTTITNGYSPRGYPKIRGLSGGGFVSVWNSNLQDGSGLGVYGQVYDTSGFPLEAEFRANNYTTNDQQYPSLAALMKGGFAIAWESLDQDGSNYGIYGQCRNASGLPVGAELRINTNTTNWQLHSSLAALINSGFVAAWQSYGQDGDGDGVYGKLYDDSCLAVGSEFRINSNTTSGQQVPVVAGLTTGGFAAAWQSYLQDGSGYGIYAKVYNASGFITREEFRVNTNTTNDQSFPAIVGLINGGFIIVWQSYLQDGSSWGIYGQRYDGAALAMGAEFRVNTNTTNDQRNPVVVALKDGGFVIAWASLGQDGSGYGIYGQRYNASTFPVGLEFRINTNTTNNQMLPDLAELADGSFVAAWQSDQNGVDSNIYGQTYDANGIPVINQSFPAPSPLSSSFVSSPITSSLTISSSSSLSASSNSAQTPSPSQTPSFLDSSSFSQAYPSILSVTEISYGASYPITVNGVNVGTFEISGGTGLVSGSSSNTLTIYLNPDVDTQGTFTLFSIPQGQEGEFQTIELVGQSCQSFEGSTTTDGSGQVVYQVIYQISTCAATGARPMLALFSNMLKV